MKDFNHYGKMQAVFMATTHEFNALKQEMQSFGMDVLLMNPEEYESRLKFLQPFVHELYENVEWLLSIVTQQEEQYGK